jgi:hypothetical protein
MSQSRIDVAETVARHELEMQLPAGTSLFLYRRFCYARVHWILRGGERPAGRAGTAFTRRVVTDAVNKGLEHAFGDSHRGEIGPDVIERRDSD